MTLPLVSTFTRGSAKPAREPFMAFVADDVSRELLNRAAAERGWPEGRVVMGGIADAIRSLAEIATPSLLVVDLTASPDPVEELGALAEVCDPGTRVITVGSVNDVELFRRLMEAGVEDYLLKPIGPESLEAALRRAESTPEEPPAETRQARQGRLVVTVGARGGVGATAVALNGAWLMAHEQKRRVALVDMDLFFGGAALALDMEPGRGFREALENPSRIDGLFIERALVRESDRLYVLAAEEALDKPFAFDPDAAELLLEKLRHAFDTVVVDLPRWMLVAQAPLLAQADAIAVVSDLSLGGMRDTLRLVRRLAEQAPEAEVKVVVNRAGAAKHGEMTPKEFAKGIGRAVDHVVPYDVKALGESMAVGRPAATVAKASKAVGTLRVVARDFSGPVEETAVKPSLMARLVGRGKRG